MGKYENWIKTIPKDKLEQFGNLGRLKISLKGCSDKKQIKKSKEFLNVFFDKHILSDNNINKKQAQEKLKMSLREYLFELNNVNIKIEDINITIDKSLNMFTIIDLLDEQIEIRNKEFLINLGEKRKAGIDTNIKNDTTAEIYATIKTNLNKYKKLNNKDLQDLTNKDFEDFKYFLLEDGKTLSSTISYFKYLKAIFNKLIKTNKMTYNPVIVPTMKKYGNNEKTIFTYKDILNINENLKDEEYKLILNILLTSGMRLEELCSLKKSNIKNGVINFFDSKFSFVKVLPIHKDHLNDLINFIDKLNLKNDDYIFLRKYNNNRRVQNVRNNLRKALKLISVDKTIHKTRTTFISYVNYYNSNFSDKDITSITHQVSGNDSSFYVATRSIKAKKEIIDNVKFEKLEAIENEIEAGNFSIPEDN